ncbi:toll/interleukin-1 receptor domain-containing protein [Candidatus Villigracilis saccharophilus]|uniref:toll/interleukin-1 receptor domain-containing protein n=1 Tax=Candidatus Villigracilis saccharophilus TaxID=3140684 RepID=UPI003135E639|nr:toll/interleukin-1 receptor domain-containing protein [Anaerolineales bacterium]
MLTPQPLRVFLCHASADKPAVRKLHRYLKQRGIIPWLDELDLLPGQKWEIEIPKALFSSDVILVCLSKNSVTKEGYVQKEITFALDKASEKLEETIFIIPTKLEECEVPQRLRDYQWVDLFRNDGYKRLMQSLKKRAIDLGPSVLPIIDDTQKSNRL